MSRHAWCYAGSRGYMGQDGMTHWCCNCGTLRTSCRDTVHESEYHRVGVEDVSRIEPDCELSEAAHAREASHAKT